LKSRLFLIPVILLVAILSVLIIPSSRALAEQDMTVIDTSTDVDYPSSLVFKVSARSASDITKIRLSYIVSKMNYAQAVSEAWTVFTPARDVATSWTWDMRHMSLPPEAIVEYWWTLENRNKRKLTTQSYSVKFSDNNYNWKNLSAGKITLFWYKGDSTFASALMEAAVQASRKITGNAGIQLERPVNIHIYNGSNDFQKSRVNTREWTGGVAATEYGAISIGISPDDIAWGKGALAHELGHMVTHQLTFSAYGINLPTWLDEGLAMHAEANSDPVLKLQLQKAINAKQLISLRSLSSPFSARTDKAYLSYAESQSAVEYLIDNYGNDKIIDLLKIFKVGSTTDEALKKIYGIDQDELESKWVESVKPAKTSMLTGNIMGGGEYW
jgi:hypothetical protein